MRVAELDRRWEAEKRMCEAWFQPGLTDPDRDWLRWHFELAGLKPPTVNTVWVTTEFIR